MPRMRILTAPEQEAFDKPPRFDHQERKKAFELSVLNEFVPFVPNEFVSV